VTGRQLNEVGQRCSAAYRIAFTSAVFRTVGQIDDDVLLARRPVGSHEAVGDEIGDLIERRGVRGASVVVNTAFTSG